MNTLIRNLIVSYYNHKELVDYNIGKNNVLCMISNVYDEDECCTAAAIFGNYKLYKKLKGNNGGYFATIFAKHGHFNCIKKMNLAYYGHVLEEAIKANNKEMIDYTLHKVDDYHSMASLALQAKNYELMNFFLENGDTSYCLLLRTACKLNEIDIFYKYFDRVEPTSYVFLVDISCYSGNKYLCDFLLEYGDFLYTAIAAACQGGQFELFKYLYEKYNYDDLGSGFMCYVGTGGSKKIFDYLEKSYDTKYAFMSACCNGHLELIKCIDNANYNEGLVSAAINDQLEVVKYFVENGATAIQKALNAIKYMYRPFIKDYLNKVKN